MGYSYTRSGALVCDGCGSSGGVRKRRCPYTVTGTSERSPSGSRSAALPYCPPPAYCPACYRERGGLRGVHGARCREGAASMQAADDARQARLDAGDLGVVSASGASRYNPDIPPGWVKVTFGGAAGPSGWVEYGVPDARYDPGARPFLSDYPDAVPWAEVPGDAPVSVPG